MLYKQYPIAVNPDFRDLVISEYPGVLSSDAFIGLMQSLLFSTFVDEDTGRLILSHKMIAAIEGVNPSRHGYAAYRLLGEFNDNVMPIDVKGHLYSRGLARTIKPNFTPSVTHALATGMANASADRVWFGSGEYLSRRAKDRIEKERRQELLQIADEARADHPGRELLDYLNGQPQTARRNLLRTNEPSVIQAIGKLPGVQREWSERLVTNGVTRNDIYYKPVDNSPRIFASGATLHQLPRDIRKLALKGSTEVDLRSCQLAVVARIWGTPKLLSFLEVGQSIWGHLSDFVGVDDTAKPIIKITIYSIVFGMARNNLQRNLADGTEGIPGIGLGRALRFFKHPLIQELLKARSNQLNDIKRNGGGVDAFDRWIPCDRKYDVRSVAAEIVQSYELRIMMSIVPILKSDRQIKTVSWLHDGASIHFGDKTERAWQIARMQRAVDSTAADLRIPTILEAKYSSV
jgi:hypothetical protein